MMTDSNLNQLLFIKLAALVLCLIILNSQWCMVVHLLPKQVIMDLNPSQDVMIRLSIHNRERPCLTTSNIKYGLGIVFARLCIV